MPYTYQLSVKISYMHAYSYLHVINTAFLSKWKYQVFITLQVMRHFLHTKQWWLYKININYPTVKNNWLFNVNMTRFLRKRFQPLILHFLASFSAVHHFQWHERLSLVPRFPSAHARPLSSGERSSSPILARSFHCHQSVYYIQKYTDLQCCTINPILCNTTCISKIYFVWKKVRNQIKKQMWIVLSKFKDILKNKCKVQKNS